MKFNKWFVALAMGLAVAACAPKAAEEAEEGEDVDQAPVEKTAKDFVPSRQTVKDVSYLVGINFGSFIKGYNFGDLDYAQIRKGMEDFINAKGNQRDEEFTKQFRVDPNTMNELFNANEEALLGQAVLSNGYYVIHKDLRNIVNGR